MGTPTILGKFLSFVGQGQQGENYLTYSYGWEPQATLGKKYALHIRDIQTPTNKSDMLGPEAPRVAAVKRLNLLHRGKCRGFFVKIFAAIFPGN